jgi:hypothetical protein
MSSPNWIGVRVAMQSAIAASKTITAITEADPGVASAVGHGYSNGDFALITAQGMAQVNNRIFRVAGQATDTFQLEDEDTTEFDTFTSGGAQKITFGTTFNTLADISGSGGDFDMVDTTTIHDLIKTQEPGLASALSFSFESLWDLSDAGLQAAIAASKTKAQRAFLFTFQNDFKMAFYGYVGATGIPKGSSGQKVKTTLTITASGTPTYYAT